MTIIIMIIAIIMTIIIIMIIIIIMQSKLKQGWGAHHRTPTMEGWLGFFLWFICFVNLMSFSLGLSYRMGRVYKWKWSMYVCVYVCM